MHADVTKGAQGLKVLHQMSLAFRVQSPPLHKPVPQTILLPSTPSQGPPLYYKPRGHAKHRPPTESSWQRGGLVGALAPHFTDEQTEGAERPGALQAAGASRGDLVDTFVYRAEPDRVSQEGPPPVPACARRGQACWGAAPPAGEAAAPEPGPSRRRLSCGPGPHPELALGLRFSGTGIREPQVPRGRLSPAPPPRPLQPGVGHPDPSSVGEGCGAAAGSPRLQSGRPSEPRELLYLGVRLSRKVGLGEPRGPLPSGSPSPRRGTSPRPAAARPRAAPAHLRRGAPGPPRPPNPLTWRREPRTGVRAARATQAPPQLPPAGS